MASDEDLPICKTCKNCASIKPYTKKRYDIDCLDNPNLGGVTAGYRKCPGYKKR